MDPKDALRRRLLAERRAMPDDLRASARAAIAGHVLARARLLPSGARVAAYEPLRTEPGSDELLTGLTALGLEVLVPITLPDRDLDWRVWPGASADSVSPLGLNAIGTAGLVLVPACAVDRAGNRLGRGGGSYDRALVRVSPEVAVAALLYEHELVDEVPTEPWDRPVSSVVTPAGWVELRG